MKKTGHKEQILIYLKSGNKLTKLESLSYFGCWNTGGRISELRKEGHNIKTTMIKNKNNTGYHARYELKPEKEAL